MQNCIIHLLEAIFIKFKALLLVKESRSPESFTAQAKCSTPLRSQLLHILTDAIGKGLGRNMALQKGDEIIA
ncbi:MAG: hypothetical protein II954_05115 [Synergistaceae bacterium]|nr:hypothetical protein [Synergistaceae bacterium]